MMMMASSLSQPSDQRASIQASLSSPLSSTRFLVVLAMTLGIMGSMMVGCDGGATIRNNYCYLYLADFNTQCPQGYGMPLDEATCRLAGETLLSNPVASAAHVVARGEGYVVEGPFNDDDNNNGGNNGSSTVSSFHYPTCYWAGTFDDRNTPIATKVAFVLPPSSLAATAEPVAVTTKSVSSLSSQSSTKYYASCPNNSLEQWKDIGPICIPLQATQSAEDTTDLVARSSTMRTTACPVKITEECPNPNPVAIDIEKNVEDASKVFYIVSYGDETDGPLSTPITPIEDEDLEDQICYNCDTSNEAE